MKQLLIIPLVLMCGCTMPHDTETVAEKSGLKIHYGLFSGFDGKFTPDGEGEVEEISYEKKNGDKLVVKNLKVKQTPSVTTDAESRKTAEITKLTAEEVNLMREMVNSVKYIADAVSIGWGNPLSVGVGYLGKAAIAKYSATQPTTQPSNP